MADGTDTGNGTPPNGDTRREFQFLVGGAIAVCLALQGVIILRLLGGNPPDASWDLIKGLLGHLGQLDLLLVGGLLGMARPHP